MKYVLLLFTLFPLFTFAQVSNSQKGPKTDTIELSSERLPSLDSLWKDAYSSTSADKYARLAPDFFIASKRLHASELAVFAARYYAKAGKGDSASIALNEALNYGMTNPKVISKYVELEVIKQAPEWKRINRRLISLEDQLSQISNFEVSTDPLDSFWPYFREALNDTTHAKNILAEYISSGSEAIKDYYAIRYFSPNNMYEQMIRETPNHYIHTQKVLDTDKLDSMKTEVINMMDNFSDLYPSAVFPKVYIMPGILNTGGTISDLGLFIGGEMFTKTDDMPTDGLNNWQRNAVSENEQMKYTIMHELMHFQQNYQDKENENTVISGVISEGVCDFLVELCSGETAMKSNVEYLSQPDSLQFILSEFKKDMHSDDLSHWMYGEVEDRPTDIGYTLGYKICKSYYERSVDKKQAVYQLLNTDNFEDIFLGSEYSN